jgi:hypothetical protein
MSHFEAQRQAKIDVKTAITLIHRDDNPWKDSRRVFCVLAAT